MSDWGFTLPGGKVVSIGDLPLEEVEGVATKHGVEWSDLQFTPARRLVAARALYRRACEINGETPVEVNSSKDLLAVITEVDLDIPATFDEGDLPLGMAPELGLTEPSSGEHELTDGPQT